MQQKLHNFSLGEGRLQLYLFKPRLGEMPQRCSGVVCRVWRKGQILAPKPTNQKCVVLLWNPLGEIGRLNSWVAKFAIVPVIDCDIGRSVVGIADLDGLVNVEHVDFVVPGLLIRLNGALERQG